MSKFITSDPPYNAGLYPTTAGFLQLENGEPLDGFSRIVTDQLGTTSPLSLSSTNLSITSYSNTYPPAIKAAPSFASTSGLDIWGATNSATEYEFIRFRNFNGAFLSQIYNYNSLLTFKVGSNEIVNLSATQARIGSTNNNTPLALFGSNSLSAIFNISNISVGGDKTFTFPNADMTFAGIDIAQTFTAAQTFNSPSEAGLNGSPIRILTDPWTSGNANQNHPLLLFGPHGGGIWAASPNGGTYIGINAVASFPGNFLDFHVNGGASVFKVAASGAVTTTAAGAASTPALSLTGTPFVGTGTTSVPLFYLNNGTAPTNWNSTANGGTFIGVNSSSAFIGNFIDLQKNGAIRFRVASTGQTTIGPGGPGLGTALSFYPNKIANGEEVTAIGNAGYDASMFFSGGSGTTNFFNGAFSNLVGVNIGTTTNTRGALLRLGAGAAAANSAPLKFTAGTLLTTPELGALEYVDNGTTGNLYFTRNVGGVVTRSIII